MAVEKLFWEDPYRTDLTAVITAVKGSEISLDRSIFFAFSGGQQSDAGTINSLAVVEARTEGREIWYRLPDNHGLKAGDPVTVHIDWERRSRLMRLHFAAELVLELINRLLDQPEKAGANISPAKARLDFRVDGKLTDLLPTLQEQCRALIEADYPIISAFSDRDAELRYWRIDGFSQVPCGGTHPRSTGEVGPIRLKRTNPGKGLERIEITLEGLWK